MGEFRIGRKFASHSYPESRAATTVPFARNFATGPTLFAAPPDVQTTGTQVPWNVIESGAPPGFDVPITPKSTGRIRITGVVAVKNSTMSPVLVTVLVQLNGANEFNPLFLSAVVDSEGAVAIPIVAELSALLAPGVQRLIEFFVFASADGAISLTVESSSIDVQEVPFATG